MSPAKAPAGPFTKARRQKLVERIALLDERAAAGGAPELLDELLAYGAGLPRVPLSRCPLTSAEVRHSIDTFGLDGPWWHYWAAVRPDEVLPPTFLVLTGAMHLGPAVEKMAFMARPGPGAPFVVPSLLVRPGVVAVMSSVAVGKHQGYAVAYYAEAAPIGPRYNSWGQDLYRSQTDGTRWWDRVSEANTPVDFELAPWISDGKLLWIAPGDEKLKLRKSTRGCPYLGLDGVRAPQVVQGGRVTVAAPLPQAPPHTPGAAATLLVYRNVAAGAVLALRIQLGYDGRATLKPGDGHTDEAMSIFGSGAASRMEGRNVGPDEGEAFIRAVHDMLARSSAWTAVPEAFAVAPR